MKNHMHNEHHESEIRSEHGHHHEHHHDHEHEHKHHHDHEHKPVKIKFRSFKMDRAFAFDPKKGEKGIITYTIAEPARVSIKVIKKGTRELYLATILNWEHRDAGTHTETWDGRDYNGNIIEDLSQSLIVMEGEPMSTYNPGKYSIEGLTDEEIIHGHKWGHPHNLYHEEANIVPELAITSVKDGDVLSGIVTIESRLERDKKGYGNVAGYGVRYYLNNILINEEFYDKKCEGRFSYDLDTTAFPDGEYTLYVGMCDHHQHTTSIGCKIRIDNSSESEVRADE